MKHQNFLLLFACLITFFIIIVVIVIFATFYAIIGDVWLSILLSLTLTALLVPPMFKLLDKIK